MTSFVQKRTENSAQTRSAVTPKRADFSLKPSAAFGRNGRFHVWVRKYKPGTLGKPESKEALKYYWGHVKRNLELTPEIPTSPNELNLTLPTILTSLKL